MFTIRVSTKDPGVGQKRLLSPSILPPCAGGNCQKLLSYPPAGQLINTPTSFWLGGRRGVGRLVRQGNAGV